MPPDEPTDEKRQEEQTNDISTPFQPANDTTPAPPADDTHPATDTGVDGDELYQEGTTSATNMPAPADPSADKEDVSDLSDAENGSDSNPTIEDKSL